MSSSDTLRQMINSAPEQINNINSSISQIDAQIDDLNTQIDGVQNGMCGAAESNLTDYLDNTKLAEIEALYGTPLTIPFSVDYGSEYGTIDYTTGGISDFRIIDTTGNVEYEYLATNWDSDATIVKLIGDYEFGNDYLTRPLTSGASYGLIPSRDNLIFAKSILQENLDEITASQTALEDYAS